MATSSEIEEFMQGPLVTWLKSCLHNSDRLQSYDDLSDGTLIHQVFLLIDPEPVHHSVAPTLRNTHARIRNISCIVKNIKVLYEEELCQLIVALPDCVRLGQKPDSKEGLEDMRLLLLLLLGCAVQCPNKQTFIENIKSLPLECQHTLVHCIRQVTESQEIVLSTDNCELLTTDLLLNHIRRLLKERDHYFQLWFSAFEEKRSSISSNVVNIPHTTDSQCQHLAGELADWKTKLRKMRQELEEKSETLAETKDELNRSSIIISKLKAEMQEHKQEARMGKAYRDEVDALREKAERCDRLESEVIKYREKLGDLDFYKGRIEELRQDNRVLEETKELVEEQLTKTKKRADYATQLESDLVKLKRTIDEITLERDAIQEKLQDLLEENTHLKLQNKTNLSKGDTPCIDDQFPLNNLGSSTNNLSEQLSSSAQTRILRLELENKRLLSTVENLQDNSFHYNNERILELEKERKKLSLLVEGLEDSKKKYIQQIAELETSLKETQSQLNRVQESYRMLQEQLELRCDDAEFSNKEKIRLKEKISEMTNEIDSLKQKADNTAEVSELQSKIVAMEKDAAKLKRITEESNVNIDRLIAENEHLEKQTKDLFKQISELNEQLFRLSEIEKDVQELQKQHQIDSVTIKNLEDDLVAEKLKNQQLKNSFDALGLAIDNITDPDKVLDRIASNPEVLKAVRERLDLEESAESSNQTSSLNNAKLQVNIITLQSQISSLTSQHTALQLANSQLAAEKEEARKEVNKLKSARQQLIEDQKILQTLHEQLNAEYDTLSKEREMLKINLKDLRAEKRCLQEKYTLLKTTCSALEMDKENLLQDSKSLVNLRTEHSKLKDDFRKLFQANEKLKTEYSTLQEEYKRVRSEAGKLKVTVTELQGELATNNEKITALELEISKLSNRCEMLVHTNSGLEDDRRSLMEHVSMLLTQYHELLTHALEDKEYYHNEEKQFVDKLNDIRRQKEKLEEKIMESYKKSENCSNKKKGFGANIVRRVKKAGSDLINKSRKSIHEESVERRATDSDTSTEEMQPKQVRNMDDNLSCLSIPGTRKTLYLSGNETVDAEDTSTNVSVNGRDEYCKSPALENVRSSTPYQDQRPPLLVYNRLTAKVGGKPTPSPSPTPSHQSNKESQSAENVKNSVWYEYGCV